jgi:hypothetical protein
MADFRVWGKVEHIGVKQFLAIVSAVPEDPRGRPIVLTTITPNLVEANQNRDRLMIELGARVRARGDRVVDVEGA